MTDTRATILVVDDEVNNLNVIVAQLGAEDYAIVTAGSGEEALEAIDRRLPDLILLDAMMPGISGFDVAEILKNEERTTNIPIIMLTALGDSSSRMAALKNGVEEFLTKPVARAELVMRIRNLLRMKKHQDNLTNYSTILETRVAERTTELASANLQLNEAHSQLLQSEKLAALGQLAAGVAHEINNPIGYVNSNLGTLNGYVSDLLKIIDAYEVVIGAAPQNPEALAALEKLKADSDIGFLLEDAPQLINESLEGVIRVRRIVQDLKCFAHVEPNPEWVKADLRAALESTLNIANNEIKYKAIVVKEYGDIPEVDCLPSQLSQVFLNLFVNAAQAIPESSSGVITVRTYAKDGYVSVEISDTGCGIPEKNLKQIFDPFFTTKPVGLGTGLGLSLSYGIVQRHNGRIEVRSQVGQGTTFSVVIPIERVA